ncbi:MAG: endolytic transglycosylase MltG [Clostridia bacterium]|nr:endolytic transglycosylase MltG [Clostridia bacterium]
MEKQRRKLKKGAVAAICGVIAAIVLIAVIAPYVSEYTKTASTDGDAVTVTIAEGSTVSDIAAALKDAGLIRSEFIFKLKVRQSGEGANLNYGVFEMHEGMSIPDIITTLVDTKSIKATVRLVVPEGYSVEQIAKSAAEIFGFGEEDFLAALSDEYDYDFLSEIPDVEGVNYKLQGFLFPETYEFFADASAHDVIDTMLGQFEKEYAEINSPYSLYETVTVAAMVEKEAKLDEERAMVAGVIYNRLDIGMRLQIDATFVYAATNGTYESVNASDKNIDSPYNTYKVSGLPAGPICNPGRESLKAAAEPASHSYYYYHTDTTKNDGSHIFTETYEEHLGTMN